MAAATTAAATQAAAQTSAVTIQGFSFGPPAIGVSVGTTVTWTNRDGTTHTVTSGTLPGAGNPSGTPDGKFDQMVDGQGGTFTFTFPQAGTVTYFCRFHSNMRASVEVR
jgi:plastocyanin